MKTGQKFAFLFLIALIVPTMPVAALAQNGDQSFWLPIDSRSTPEAAQVARNKEYISVKLHAVFAYYKSSFLENIKQLIVASDIATSGQNALVEGTMVNKNWQKLESTGDFIGINDLLAALTPTTPTSIRLKISFRGIGSDKFKPIFDILSSPDLKTALTLSDATVGRIGGVSSIVQKLLASPYTSDNPRQILDVEQQFVLYPEGAPVKIDALKEGFLVVVSTRGRNTQDLTLLQSLDKDSLRLSPVTQQGLQYKSAQDGAWKSFDQFSYAIFSVTKFRLRGEDQTSAWFNKYQQAFQAADKISDNPTSGGADNIKTEAMGLWREGNALLSADPNYIQDERDSIQSLKVKQIRDRLSAAATRLDPAVRNTLLTFEAKDIRNNFAEIADNYSTLLEQSAGELTITTNKAAQVALADQSNPSLKRTTQANDQGLASFKSVMPGKYVVTVTNPGFGVRSASIDVYPGEKKAIAVM
jgi:hypothetical protein